MTRPLTWPRRQQWLGNKLPAHPCIRRPDLREEGPLSRAEMVVFTKNVLPQIVCFSVFFFFKCCVCLYTTWNWDQMKVLILKKWSAGRRSDVFVRLLGSDSAKLLVFLCKCSTLSDVCVYSSQWILLQRWREDKYVPKCPCLLITSPCL